LYTWFGSSVDAGTGFEVGSGVLGEVAEAVEVVELVELGDACG
jgi:hypothetical protein